jgi:hypothetical protein
MIAVFVTFRFGEEFDAAKLRRVAVDSGAKFENMPGLRSKLFSINSELREACNVYVWDDERAAHALFSQETRERIAVLYGARPIIEFAEVAALVDNRPA